MWISAAALILWTLFIWGNSLLSGPASMEKSQSVINVVKPTLYFLGLPVEQWQFYVRKAAHFLEFAILGGLWFLNLQGRISSGWRLFLLSLGASALTAGLDEFLQSFTGRTAQLSDVFLDTSGALAGIGICFLSLWILRRKRSS